MPYIELNTNTKVTEREELCRKLTERIVAINGKKPEKTMVRLADEQYMFFAMNTERCARVKIDLFRPSEFEDKAAYNREITKLLKEVLDIPAERIYLSFTEYAEWGSNNNYRK